MATEIIIVDDDPLVGDLSNDLLGTAGYTTGGQRHSSRIDQCSARINIDTNFINRTCDRTIDVSIQVQFTCSRNID